MADTTAADGIRAMVPRERMCEAARKLRDAYGIVPGAPLYRREFGYFVLERWKAEGHITDATDMSALFLYDPPGKHSLMELGWCEAAFQPAFEEKILEDRGDYEVVQDVAGRKLLCFKGRRTGFMPEYLDHPVKDRKTWEDNVKWRLDPATAARHVGLDKRMGEARAEAARGLMITQQIIGPYMYLRSLFGPVELLYAFYDMGDLVHDCMEAWLTLADAVTARHQEHLTIDEAYFGEDICYNHGALISPEMMREFILPYYQQLITNIRRRQIDKSRRLFVQIDSDGYVAPVIPLYRAIGMDVMSPFEVAAGNDLVAIGRQYPDLVMAGGIDKRVMAAGPRAIDAFLERVIPPMRERGGYIPTCDHGVPEEVTFEDYMYYRRRVVELGG